MSTGTIQRVVLLVHHHDDSREMYAEFLGYHGFKVLSLANGDDAFDVASQADVVVTGIRLGGPTDGITLIQRLRDDPRTARTPIIVVAADVFASDYANAATAGCDAFLMMPCEPDELLREVRRVLLHRVVGKPLKAHNSDSGQKSRRHRNRRGGR